MKVLLSLFALLVAVMAVAVVAVVQIIIELAPILALIAVAVVVARALQARRRPLPPALPAARIPVPAQTSPPPRPVGWAPHTPGGWVMLPVWMGAPPVAWNSAPTVIDAEVIGDERRD
jgi:hypothetical protein